MLALKVARDLSRRRSLLPELPDLAGVEYGKT